MAHVAKYKAAAAPSMMRHYRRDREGTMRRDNIDPARTADNYVLGWVMRDDGSQVVSAERVRMREGGACCVSGTERVRSGGWDEVRARMARVEEESGRKVRKDAVVLADMVITAPEDVPSDDLVRFFAYSYIYVSKQVGRENMLGGYVHMDEKTPHMHVPFTPITTNDKGKPTFSYKRLCPRSFYQRFHQGLGDYLEKRLGYRPSIELTEEQREERIYVERVEDIDAARATVAERVTAPAREEREQLEQEVGQLRAQVEGLERERGRLQGIIDGQRDEIDELSGQVSDLREERDWWQASLDALVKLWDAIVEAVRFLREKWDAGGISRSIYQLEKLADSPILAEPTAREREQLKGTWQDKKQRKLFERAQRKSVAPTRAALDDAQRRIDALREDSPMRPGRGRAR